MDETRDFTASAPSGVASWDRIRFRANEDDPRPVTWPPPGPWWCSGYGDGYAVVVAYVPHGYTDKQVKKLWPEATEINRMQLDEQIVFSDRFARPSWWKTPEEKHNACTEPCDNPNGPCACGAWHKAGV